MKFIGVIHKWWMYHEAWEILPLDMTDKVAAEKELVYQTALRDRPFHHATGMMLEIADTESLSPKGTRLTLWQRLTGRL